MVSKYFMGVDPGMTGAIALVCDDGRVVGVWDYPGSAPALSHLVVKIRGDTHWPDTRPPEISLAVIEHVHPFKGQGISSTGKFMKNAGIWEGVIAAKGIPYELITPQRWRKILDSSVPRKPTKEDLRQYAIRRWPAAMDALKRVKDHNRAEAILLAEYAMLKFLGIAK